MVEPSMVRPTTVRSVSPSFMRSTPAASPGSARVAGPAVAPSAARLAKRCTARPTTRLATLFLTLGMALAFALPGSGEAQQTPDEDPDDGHTVVRGECLWCLAERYYENPFEWPRIYEANQALIDDPHWIYPGQELNIPGFGTVVVGVEVPAQPDAGAQADADADAAAAARAAAEERARAAAAAASANVYPGLDDRTVFSAPPRTNIPTPGERTTFYGSLSRGGGVGSGGVLGTETVEHLAVSSDIFYSSPWLVAEGREESAIYPGIVTGWAGAQAQTRADATIHPYDEVRIRWREGRPPSEGSRLQLVRVERSEEDLGHVIQPTAIGRVVERGDSSVVVVVTNAYRRPRSGDYALVAPTFSLRPGEYAVDEMGELRTGLLGYARDRRMQQLDDIAFLPIGIDQGVSVGDVFAAEAPDGRGRPSDVSFELEVVRVFDDHATARISAIRVPHFPPDAQVRRVRRMP